MVIYYENEPYLLRFFIICTLLIGTGFSSDKTKDFIDYEVRNYISESIDIEKVKIIDPLDLLNSSEEVAFRYYRLSNDSVPGYLVVDLENIIVTAYGYDSSRPVVNDGWGYSNISIYPGYCSWVFVLI